MDSKIFAYVPVLIFLCAIGLRGIALTHPDSHLSGRALLTTASYYLLGFSLFATFVAGILVLGDTQNVMVLFAFILEVFISILLIKSEIQIAGVRQRARRVEMLWVLALAVKSGRPLEDEIAAYAKGSTGRWRRSLTEMAERLHEGVSLTELVVPQGLLPQSAAMQIHAGITSHSLKNSLSQTSQRITEEFAENQDADFSDGGLAYSPALLTVASLIVCFLMYWIMPKFLRIFDDFGGTLPRVTVAFVEVSNTFARYWFAMGLPVLVYIPLVILCFSVFADYYGWNETLKSLLGRWFIRWYTPDLLRALSQSLARGIPMNDAIRPIIEYTGPLKLRKALGKAVEAMKGGTDSWQALCAIGTLNPDEVGLLEIAQRNGNLPWVLNSLARSIERRRVFRIRSLIEFSQPMLLIPVGIMVAFILMAFFVPLIELLNQMS